MEGSRRSSGRYSREIGMQDGAGALQPPAEELDEPQQHERSRTTDRDPEEEISLLAEKYHLKLNDTLSAFFSKGVPAVNLFLLLSFVGKMLYNEPSIGLWWSIIYLTCLVLSLFIHMGMFTECWTRHVARRSMIAYLSTILRMSAAAALVLFSDTVHAVALLPLSLSVLALLAYWFRQTFWIGEKPGMNWGEHKEELELRFDMSAQVVSMGFGGLSGKVLGYAKGSSKLTSGFRAVAVVVAPECLLFYSVVLGLLVVLVCTVPPRVRFMSKREHMATRHIPICAYAALSFLVLASVLAAQGIIQEHVFLVCTAIAAFALVFYCYEHRAANWPVSREERLPEFNDPTVQADNSAQAMRGKYAKYSQYMVPGYFTPLFAALMASHSKYGMESSSNVPLSWWFKGFVLSAMCSILSYAIHIVLLAEMKDPRRWAKSRKMCFCATLATMPISVAFAILVWFLHPDEVKNII